MRLLGFVGTTPLKIRLSGNCHKRQVNRILIDFPAADSELLASVFYSVTIFFRSCLCSLRRP